MSVYYYLGNVYTLYLQSHISLMLGVVSLEFYKLQQLGYSSATGYATHVLCKFTILLALFEHFTSNVIFPHS